MGIERECGIAKERLFLGFALICSLPASIESPTEKSEAMTGLKDDIPCAAGGQRDFVMYPTFLKCEVVEVDYRGLTKLCRYTSE